PEPLEAADASIQQPTSERETSRALTRCRSRGSIGQSNEGRGKELPNLLRGMTLQSLSADSIGRMTMSVDSYPVAAQDLIDNECAAAMADTNTIKVRVVSRVNTGFTFPGSIA
ncbi:unnamed protein product, partial [Polarella glacialis]